jgi:SPX domain protein involved in polyphosphate accumulation
MFSEIYHQRYVNSLYFDTVSLASYYDNLSGVKDRMKIRIRWYGELFGKIAEPVLEFKAKDGWAGWKALYKLPSLTLTARIDYNMLIMAMAEIDLPEHLPLLVKSVEPIIIIRYRRKYFRSSNNNFRITIDTKLSYHAAGKHDNIDAHKYTDHISKILELKYQKEFDNQADEVTKHLPFRLSKSSKYVNGISRLLGYEL